MAFGLEFADAAASPGLDVTSIEAAERLLAARMPAALSPLLQQRHATRGVHFTLGVRIERIVDCADAPNARIELMNGECVEADLCLMAIGQTPNDAPARDAGIETGNGIHVEVHCRTSAPNVLAAGDCANFPFGFSGRRVRLESWQNAGQQNRVAAATALGIDAAYAPLPWFWADQTA